MASAVCRQKYPTFLSPRPDAFSFVFPPLSHHPRLPASSPHSVRVPKNLHLIILAKAWKGKLPHLPEVVAQSDIHCISGNLSWLVVRKSLYSDRLISLLYLRRANQKAPLSLTPSMRLAWLAAAYSGEQPKREMRHDA